MIKAPQLFLVMCAVMTSLQCKDAGIAENTQARIAVYVHWGETPIPGIKSELVQTGESRMTDNRGLAEFVVQPGSYVIRVYGINRGGPVRLYVDFNVEVNRAESRTVDVIDCIPCL